jgi:prepilin-type N-terminal cleavage/methylation domain-containing protein
MKPSNTHGFTLIEVVIVVAIVGILSMIAIPNFIGWLPRYRLNLAAQDVLSGMIKARTKAVKDNTWVVFRPSTTNTGFFAFVDNGAGSAAGPDGEPIGSNDGAQTASELTTVRIPLPSGISITSSFQTSFDRKGLPDNPGTITLRNSRGQTRQISLLATGFAQII